MKLFDWYVFKAILEMTLIVLFVFVALSGFVDFVGQINDIGIGDYGVNQAIQYTLLKLPSSIFQLMPIAVFDRPKFSNISLSSISAIAFSKNRYSDKIKILRKPIFRNAIN